MERNALQKNGTGVGVDLLQGPLEMEERCSTGGTGDGGEAHCRGNREKGVN